MYQILIVDDDVQMLDMVEIVLKREGYHVLRANSAEAALQLVDTNVPDLFVIDVMMPNVDGLQLCRQLRERPETARHPIIFLTGIATQSLSPDRALDSGADDYIRKPFMPRELVARVRALIRRTAQYNERNATPIQLIVSECRVIIGERAISLTRMEFDLLRFLCQTPFQMYTAEDLLARVWRYPDGVGDAALVRNHIRNIRRKIEIDPERPLILQSRHGRGYVVKANPRIENDYALGLS